MSSNYCISCGAEIPEGNYVCKNCLNNDKCNKYIIIDKLNDKAILYSQNNSIHFIIAKLYDKSFNIGDIVTKYISGDNRYFNNIKDAILSFYNIKYNWETIENVMDNINLYDFGIFECSQCGETKDISRLCIEHYDKFDNVCKDCCEYCGNDELYYNNLEQKNDELRGK